MSHINRGKSNDTRDRSVSMNKNVNWMNSSHFWIFYILLLLAIRAGMPIVLDEEHAWTGTSVVHGVVKSTSYFKKIKSSYRSHS